MYKAWSASAEDGTTLARGLEAHLNEFAHEVVSVSYAIDKDHHVLAVYRPVAPDVAQAHEAAVSLAEQIIDKAQF